MNLDDPVFSFGVRRLKLLHKATYTTEIELQQKTIDDILDQGGVHPFMGFHKIKYDAWFPYYLTKHLQAQLGIGRQINVMTIISLELNKTEE